MTESLTGGYHFWHVCAVRGEGDTGVIPSISCCHCCETSISFQRWACRAIPSTLAPGYLDRVPRRHAIRSYRRTYLPTFVSRTKPLSLQSAVKTATRSLTLSPPDRLRNSWSYKDRDQEALLSAEDVTHPACQRKKKSLRCWAGRFWRCGDGSMLAGGTPSQPVAVRMALF